jgi:MYXO-CTERM domain-containing protein
MVWAACVAACVAVMGCGRGEAPAVDPAGWVPAPGGAVQPAREDGGLRRFVREGEVERAVFEPPSGAARQLGFMLEGEDPWALRFRAQWEDGRWSDWTEVEVTHSEGRLHVARALLAEPAVRVELDAGGGLSEASVQLYGQVAVDARAPLARDLPRAEWRPSAAAIAPSDLVVPREGWGARDPGKICGGVVEPYRVSVHHTASPADDGGDAAARMRQMQAYHMDSNGWCDIGYHFVVAQSGVIYQGRSDERRPGAHVGNQNAGNIGVSFIGNFSEQEFGEVQMASGARLMRWIKDTYEIPWDRESVRGHREWPGQSTGCPGDDLLASLDELMGLAEQPVEADVGFGWSWLDGVEDVVDTGSSAGVPDMFVGGVARAQVVMTNGTASALRGVEWGTALAPEHLRARDHRIDTDWPERDLSTWAPNDANDVEGNPAPGALGARADWVMNAFGAGESKRIWLELEAARYSFGEQETYVRAWARQIDGIYGVQESWDDAVEENAVVGGELLRAQGRVDVFARDAWLFEGAAPEDTEGWTSCGEAEPARVEGGWLKVASGCATSPAWTSLDADAWDALVLEVRNTGGRAQLDVALGSSAGGRVNVQASAREQILVLPLAELDGWSGEVGSLALRTDAAQGLEVGAIWLQRADTQATSTARVEYAAQTPASLRDTGFVDIVSGGGGEFDGGGDGGGGGGGGQEPEGDRITTQGCVCASAPGAPPEAPLAWWALGFAGVCVMRRRRCAR